MWRGSFKFCPLCGDELDCHAIEGNLRSFCSNCQWIHYENPLPTAAAFVCGLKKEILLIKRGVSPGKGLWALPSGFIEIDETPEKACLRELKEETGLKGHIEKLIGVYSQKSLLYKNVIIMAYRIEASGYPKAGSDSLQCEFFLKNRLPRIAFSSHRRIIDDGISLMEI